MLSSKIDKNPNLLFIGNDLGIYFSLDGGASWQPMEGNIPVVPIKDLTIHPRENDLVAGTYGRGLYVTNINTLQQLNPEILNSSFSFFNIQTKPARNKSEAAYWGNNRLMGDNHLFTPNEPGGVNDKLLDERGYGKIRLPSTSAMHRATVIDTIPGSNLAGINQAYWYTWEEEAGDYSVSTHMGSTKLSKDF